MQEHNLDSSAHYENNNRQGPPNLDELFSRLWRLFTKKSYSSRYRSDGSNKYTGLWIVIILLFTIILLWVFSGFYIVDPAQRAVILRFGKYTRIENPGLHWVPRLIEKNYLVNVQKVSAYRYSDAMLTKDENIVIVHLVVHYRIDNIRNYLFNVVDPELNLQQATASALRQIVGNTSLEGVLTKQRAQVRLKTEKLLKQILNIYKSGLSVVNVMLQPTTPPKEVTEAFDDAIKAREDQQRYINNAQGYSNNVVPLAQGQAQRLLQESRAYKQQIIFKAKGRVSRFLAMLLAYNKAPKVTWNRLYLDAMEYVLQNSHKVLVDSRGSNNLLFPLQNRNTDESYNKIKKVSYSNFDDFKRPEKVALPLSNGTLLPFHNIDGKKR